jgi:hypothetical protein
MNVARLFSCLSACLFLALATNPSTAQQPAPNPLAACGATPANFSIKHASPAATPLQPPSGKALVYFLETMPTTEPTFFTEKVNIGLDGSWISATDADTYISFSVDPGVHHLCAVYQGEAGPMDNLDQTLLLHLNAKAGQTYYLRYQAFFLRGATGVAFFNPTDEDEGRLLLQRSQRAISKLKK